MSHDGLKPDKARHKQLRRYKAENYAFAIDNPNEEWIWQKLLKTKWDWCRQALWSQRMFDFWCPYLGVAIEVDGPEHDPVRDKARDTFAWKKAGIIVIRIRNNNENDATIGLTRLDSITPWSIRQNDLIANSPTVKWQFHVRGNYDYRHVKRGLVDPTGVANAEIPW